MRCRTHIRKKKIEKQEEIAKLLKKVKETKGYLRDDSLDPEHPGIKNLQKILDDLLKEREGTDKAEPDTDKAEPDTDKADPNPPFDRAPGPPKPSAATRDTRTYMLW